MKVIRVQAATFRCCKERRVKSLEKRSYETERLTVALMQAVTFELIHFNGNMVLCGDDNGDYYHESMFIAQNPT